MILGERMSLWSVGKGIIWSYWRGKLYTARAKSGQGHRSLHVANSIPTDGEAFDRVPRGRALVTDRYKLIEVVSPGAGDHIANDCYRAIIQHLGLEGREDEVEVLEPNWDSAA
jgi:hypothetical protein